MTCAQQDGDALVNPCCPGWRVRGPGWQRGGEPHVVSAHAAQPAALALLTDPFLQAPEPNTVRVVWFTEFAGTRHVVLVGKGVDALGDADLHAAPADGRRAPVPA